MYQRQYKFSLSLDLDKNKIFLINRGDLKDRIDPLYNKYILQFKLNEIETIKLNDVLFDNPMYGANESSIEFNNFCRYIRITDIDEFGLLKKDGIRSAEKEELKYKVHLNDILFARSGATVGKAYIHLDSSLNAIFAGYLIRFRVNESLLLSKFLFYFTQTTIYKEWVNAIQRTAGQPNINAEEYKSLLIPNLKLGIQQNIIDMMDKAYESKKQKEKEAQGLLDNIDDYLFDKLGIKLPVKPENNIENITFKVGFDDIFGDRLDADSYTSYYQNIFDTFEKSTCKFTTLKTITKKIKTGTTPDQKLDAFTIEKEIVFLRNSDIQDGEIIEDKFKYIKNNLEKYLTFSYKNEIIICIAGTIGISALNRFDRLAINQNVSSLTIDETQININFLISWLNTRVAISLLKRLASIATIAYVNNPTLLRLQIPLPAITIQNKIVDEIKRRKQKAKQLQEEAKLELENAKKEVERIILGNNYEC
ncbi:type IIB restriction/modification system, specificity subunit [Aliarcobacter faecis]|uniref:restriction endonuclease subunit S n=1 Tax=Aliarcobacter faecis TaxID=1564138 RepID=UPI00047D7064|nr:restriction endonuclease subunit S [Aliarcobacter faecis]QKF72368.1 type IIB restriction/modification system, specificity subunit [Aliarcobacter faecis]